MKKFLAAFAALLAIGLVCLAAACVWVGYELKKPGPFESAQEFLVEPGSNGLNVAEKLAAENVINQPRIFYALLRVQPISIKAGEYALPARASLQDIFEILRKGEIIQRNVTLAEGLTVKQALVLLLDNALLNGEITVAPEEGTLLPDTYNFIRGDTRDDIIKRMQAAQKKLLDDMWAKRDPALPLQSPAEAVVLASIVEKETGVASERAKIAGLFYNRLKLGMKLQSDPTVVYVITDHLGSMQGQRLYAKNLAVDSPYNTYQNAGLPPGPIANPGRAAMEAVLHPEAHDYLYFVADGSGGHVFARTLDEHNANVEKWRAIKNNR